MKLLLCLLGLSFLQLTHVDAQSVLQGWAGKMGGTGLDAGTAIATDGVGNSYITGGFNGTSIQFDPFGTAPGTQLTSQAQDAFVVKLNPAGNAVWAKNMGGTGADIGRAIGVDGNGNVYVAGTFTAAANILGTNLTAAGGSGIDIFVCKLSGADGSLIWAKRAGGGSTDNLWDLAVDPRTGSVYITGSYMLHATNADFGTTTLTSAGSQDAFISKLDRNGDFKWAQSIGGTGLDAGYGIALHPGTNSLAFTGNFTGSVTFSAGYTFTPAGTGTDIFVYKCDTNGAFTWVKQMGGPKADQPRDIAIDPSGNIYTTGYFKDSANFNPNGSYWVHGEFAYQDIFVSKLSAAGNFVYAAGVGGPPLPSGSEEEPKFYGEAIAVDAAGKAYVTGRIDYSTVDFAPGPDVYYARSKGNSDIFVMGFTDNGGLSWVRTFGAASNDVGNGISLDDTGNVYITGAFFNTIVFNTDPQAATPSLASGGSSDIFVHKIRQASCISSIAPIIAQQACDSFRYAGTLYTTSQTFSALAVNAAGCDSMITFNLTVSASSLPSSYTPPVHCDSFVFHGVTYTQTGLYNQTLANAAGCDSVVTIDLTIVHSSWDTLFRVTNCEGFTYDTVTYLETGFYVHTYTHSNGCDSNVVLSLTIDTVNVAVTAGAEQLTAAEANGVWQWLDCNDQYAPVSGADSQSFTPQQSGSYAVAVTVDGCTDTSACVPFTVPASVSDVNGAVVWKLYPNPVHSSFFVETTVGGKLVVYTPEGKLVIDARLRPGRNEIGADMLQQGIYLVKITDVRGNTLGLRKFVKMSW